MVLKHCLMLFTVAIGIALPSCSRPIKTAKEIRNPVFLPPPISDDWSKWIVGEWEGSAESDTGGGKYLARIEPALNGQFLICRGQAIITEITTEQAEYLRKNMNASDEEIERFKSSPYQSMEIYTIDQTTGEVVGYLFDSLRCMAAGRGKREGNKEIIEWEWATGHKSTRITEKVSDDRMEITQRTPMPDGSVMEEKGYATRRKGVLRENS